MKKNFAIFSLILVGSVMLILLPSCKKSQKPTAKKTATKSVSVDIHRSSKIAKTEDEKDLAKKDRWKFWKNWGKKKKGKAISVKKKRDKDWWKFWKSWGKKKKGKAVSVKKKRDKDWWKFWKNWGKKGKGKAIVSKKRKRKKKKGPPFIVLNWEALGIKKIKLTKKQRKNVFVFGGIALAGIGIVVATTLLHHPKV